MVPIVMALLTSGHEHALGLAAVLFAIAAATDFFDGYLARRWGITTILGAFLDSTADKLLVSGSLIALVAIDRASIWPVLIIIMREFTVMALRGITAMEGHMVKPSIWGKIKAIWQKPGHSHQHPNVRHIAVDALRNTRILHFDRQVFARLKSRAMHLPD